MADGFSDASIAEITKLLQDYLDFDQQLGQGYIACYRVEENCF